MPITARRTPSTSPIPHVRGRTDNPRDITLESRRAQRVDPALVRPEALFEQAHEVSDRHGEQAVERGCGEDPGEREEEVCPAGREARPDEFLAAAAAAAAATVGDVVVIVW